jgi:hypothetical protein
VAIRATAAFRSRKFPDQLAVGERAKARNVSRASLLKVTRRPAFSAKRSSSKSRFGSMSSKRFLSPGSEKVSGLARNSRNKPKPSSNESGKSGLSKEGSRKSERQCPNFGFLFRYSVLWRARIKLFHLVARNCREIIIVALAGRTQDNFP